MLGLRLNPRIHMKYLGVVRPDCNPSTEVVGTGGSLQLTGQARSLLDEFETSESPFYFVETWCTFL